MRKCCLLFIIKRTIPQFLMNSDEILTLSLLLTLSNAYLEGLLVNEKHANFRNNYQVCQ